jgi:hypothetical protein
MLAALNLTGRTYRQLLLTWHCLTSHQQTTVEQRPEYMHRSANETQYSESKESPYFSVGSLRCSRLSRDPSSDVSAFHFGGWSGAKSVEIAPRTETFKIPTLDQTLDQIALPRLAEAQGPKPRIRKILRPRPVFSFFGATPG